MESKNHKNFKIMKQVLILITLFMVGCSHHKQLIKKYPDCEDYFNYIIDNWEGKDNGFYIINEVKDTTLNEWQQLEAPPYFVSQWDKYNKTCLNNLTLKEVESLFGKPTKISKVKNVQINKEVKTYLYYISDGNCKESIPIKNSKDNCGGISFTFVEGKIFEKSKPNLFQSGNDYLPIKK